MVFRVKKLLHDYEKEKNVIHTEKINFTGVNCKDVYNITAPFKDDGQLVIAGRVEKRNTEYSDTVFFIENDGIWEPRKATQTYPLQDPFITFIGGQLIFGGVEVFKDPKNRKKLLWRTVFYKGENIKSLKPLVTGPVGMKDIRLLELPDQTIGVFTRPKGNKKGGRGKIGFTIISSLEELTISVLENAPLIKAHFKEDEWGGVNETFVDASGKIKILGHIAFSDEEGKRHYYPVTFEYRPTSNKIESMKIISIRREFAEGEAKRSDLRDVLFSGGLNFKENGKVELYVGVSDVEAHKATIPNPFSS